MSLFISASNAGAFSRSTTIFAGAKITKRVRNVKYGKSKTPHEKTYHEIKLPPSACEKIGIAKGSFVDLDYSPGKLVLCRASRGFKVKQTAPGRPLEVHVPVFDDTPLPDDMYLEHEAVAGDFLNFTVDVADIDAPAKPAKKKNAK
jgi:hypothetical protein